MHPRTAALTDLLNRTRADLCEAVRAVPPSVAPLRPTPDEWSPAEIVDHLRVVEGGIVRLLGRLLDQAGPLPPASDEPGRPDAPDPFGMLDRTRRITAPERVRPSPTPDVAAAFGELEQSRRALHALLARTDGRATGRIVAPHPLLGPLAFEEWVTFVAHHEARHTAQLRDALARLD
jgi:hypothetical protein